MHRYRCLSIQNGWEQVEKAAERIGMYIQNLHLSMWHFMPAPGVSNKIQSMQLKVKYVDEEGNTISMTCEVQIAVQAHNIFSTNLSTERLVWMSQYHPRAMEKERWKAAATPLHTWLSIFTRNIKRLVYCTKRAWTSSATRSTATKDSP